MRKAFLMKPSPFIVGSFSVLRRYSVEVSDDMGGYDKDGRAQEYTGRLSYTVY